MSRCAPYLVTEYAKHDKEERRDQLRGGRRQSIPTDLSSAIVTDALSGDTDGAPIPRAMYSVLDAILRISLVLRSFLATSGFATIAPAVLLVCLVVAAVRRRLLHPKPRVQNAQSSNKTTSTSSASDTRATQELAETPQDSPSSPHTDTPFTATASPALRLSLLLWQHARSDAPRPSRSSPRSRPYRRPCIALSRC